MYEATQLIKGLSETLERIVAANGNQLEVLVGTEFILIPNDLLNEAKEFLKR